MLGTVTVAGYGSGSKKKYDATISAVQPCRDWVSGVSATVVGENRFFQKVLAIAGKIS